MFEQNDEPDATLIDFAVGLPITIRSVALRDALDLIEGKPGQDFLETFRSMQRPS